MKFVDQTLTVEKDGTKVARLSLAHDPSGSSGWAVRAFQPETKHFEWRDSYFDDELPRWIEGDGAELVPGRGTPTIVFLDLATMRMLGVGYGELRTARICAVHDLDSALHLEWLSRRHKAPIATLVTHTRIFRSRETSVVQSGHKITGVRVSGGKQRKVRSLIGELKRVSRSGKHAATLKKYGIKPGDTILWEYNIDLLLEPYT